MRPGGRVAAFVALLAAIFAGGAVAGGAVGPAHHDHGAAGTRTTMHVAPVTRAR